MGGGESNNTPLRAVVHSNWMAQQSGDGDEMDDTKGTERKTQNTELFGVSCENAVQVIVMNVCMFVFLCL